MPQISVNDSEIFLLDLDDQELHPVTRTPGAWRDAVFDATGTGVYVLGDYGGEFVSLWLLDLNLGLRKRDREVVEVTPELGWNVENLAISADRQTLAYTVNEHGYGTLYLVDTSTGETARPDLPPSIISGLRFAREAAVLGFTLAGPTRVPDVWTLDLDSGAATQWTSSEIGGLDPERFIAPSVETVESFDGLEVPFFFYRPDAASKSSLARASMSRIFKSSNEVQSWAVQSGVVSVN